MIETINKTREYLNYLEEHYNNVQEAWKIIQNKCNGKGKLFPFLYDDFKFYILDKMIKEHDISKLSQEEFIPYRKSFFATESEDKEAAGKGFEKAWQHHKKENTHHWENWTNSNNGDIYQELDLIHNICDWMAMGIKFNDTAREFYKKNKDKIKIPEWAEKLMFEIFDCVYGEA